MFLFVYFKIVTKSKYLNRSVIFPYSELICSTITLKNMWGLHKMKGLKALVLVVLMACVSMFAVSADLGTDITLETKIDHGHVHSVATGEINRVSFTRGDILEVDIWVLNENSNVTYRDVEITGFISGYEFNTLEPMSATTGIFDVEPNTRYRKKLQLRVPASVDRDDYRLRIIVSDRNNPALVEDYRLRLDAPRRGFSVMDVVFSPGTTVEAGRALLTTARVENKGQFTESSVKVTVAVPDLGISASDFIDRVRVNDAATTEEMYLRIPACAPAGTYEVVLEVRYNQLREAIHERGYIRVVEGDLCQALMDTEDPKAPSGETVITVGATSQVLTVGKAGAVYPLSITNDGASSRSYTVSVQGTNDFASVQINPKSTFVLGAGDSQAVFLYVTPLADAAEGQRVFTLTVSSADEVLKQVPLTATVEKGEEVRATAFALRDALEIGLIVLVVLLIVLAVVVGVKKLKRENEDDEDENVEGKTYY